MSVGTQPQAPNTNALPNFSGRWTGEYVIATCQGFADFRTCGNNMRNPATGSPYRYTVVINLSQAGERLTGTLEQSNGLGGERIFPMSGSVRSDGSVILESSIPRAGAAPTRISNWSSTPGDKRLTGRYTVSGQTFLITGTPVDFSYTNEFSNLTR